ncbi:MAG: hypothetical protein ABI607_08685 [Betaproteobacteria bacterium]
MRQASRLLVAAFAAVVAIFGAPASGQVQGQATVNVIDPTCAAWAIAQSGSAANGWTFTLTCQALACSIISNPASPVPGENVGLTASCKTLGNVNASPTASYVWSFVSGPTTGTSCPAISSNTSLAALTGPANTTTGCVYKVLVDDTAVGNGKGSATKSSDWANVPYTPSTCQSVTVSPPNNSGSPSSILLTANCTAGKYPIAVYLFYGPTGQPIGAFQASATLTIPAPTATSSYTVIASDGLANSNTSAPGTYTVGTGGSNGFDLSACTAAGYSGHGIDIAYPVTGNTPRVLTPTFGNFGGNDMMVVRFVAPAFEPTPGSTIAASEYSVYPSVQRLATLSTQPCVVATSSAVGGTILASTAGSSVANLYMALVGTGLGYQAKLTPGATYYINYVNRTGYGGADSCTLSGSSNCAMYIDFKN